MKLITVYNTGHVKWLDGNGPFFGIPVSDGLFGIMRYDPTLRMKLTTKIEAEQEQREYYAELAKVAKKEAAEKANSTVDSFVARDELKITPIKVEEKHPPLVKEPVKEELDNEIDNLLNDIPEEIQPTPVEKPEVKKYTEEELKTYTKRQMKQILKERGYLEGPNAGKYHDTVEMLIAKVLRTQ